ncbi:MAG: extracellular solute-binding protein [Nitriliruptorales bacterium]|nr:extracellular solute-binding protein [Nitriliruptorales bacterium]
MTGRTWMHRLAVLAVFSLLAAACLQEDSGGGGGTAGGTEGADGAAGPVTMLGAFTDEDGYFRDMINEYNEQTGAQVEYEGSADFETVAVSRIEGGNPPDILLFPQPGLMADFARRDQIQPLDDKVDRADIEERLQAGLIDLGLVDDQLYAIPVTINLKSLVWYPKKAFDDAGYEVPETLDDLKSLTEQIKADGTDPWCVGIEASGSTGWVATDWIEDLVLRQGGPELYDAWVAGDTKFSDPEIIAAAEHFEELVLTDGNTLGGRTGIVTTPFGDAPAPLFEEPPACMLHKQASFIFGSFPEEAEYGTDYDVFYFPQGEFEGKPLMGAGDIASLATDNEAAVEFLKHLTTAESFEKSRAQEGGTLFAYTDFTADQYPNEVDKRQAEVLEEADSFRFDGSDLMPGEVGTGSFWTEMVSYINNEKDLQQAMEAIDSSWPSN